MTEANAPISAAVSPAEMSAERADATIRSKQYVALLVVVAVTRVILARAPGASPWNS